MLSLSGFYFCCPLLCFSALPVRDSPSISKIATVDSTFATPKFGFAFGFVVSSLDLSLKKVVTVSSIRKG